MIVNTTMFAGSLLTAATVFVLMLTLPAARCASRGGRADRIGLRARQLRLSARGHDVHRAGNRALRHHRRRTSRFGRRRPAVGPTSSLCGACAATALLFRASAVLFLPLFGVYCIVVGARAKDIRRGIEWGAWYTAGAVGPLLALLAMNWWRYGRATNFGYAIDKATSRKYPILRGLSGQWLSSGKSVFLYAPIAIVVVAGLWWAVRRAPMAMCLLGGIVGVNTLFFARVQFWSGDWAWGPRYMQIVLPCLAAMAAPLMVCSPLAARRARSRRARAPLLRAPGCAPAVHVPLQRGVRGDAERPAAGPRGTTATTRSPGTPGASSRSCGSCVTSRVRSRTPSTRPVGCGSSSGGCGRARSAGARRSASRCSRSPRPSPGSGC